MNLNEQQQAALEQMGTFLKGKERHFLLEGFAGTGKTFSVQQFLLSARVKKLAIAAPTNKAVKVIRDFGKTTGLDGAHYATVHRLLGLKAQVDPDTGKQVFVPDPWNKTTLENFDLVVIDEASMVGKPLYDLVCRYMGKKTKIVWMGDPAQLPPVGEKHSPVFSTSNRVLLTQIMRHGGSIQGAVNLVRDRIGKGVLPEFLSCNDGNEGVWSISKRQWLQRLETDFTSQSFKADSDFVRAVAWTNRVVDWGNNRIHRAIYGDDAKPFMPGQRVVARDPVVDGEEILMTTSEEATVITAEPTTAKGLAAWELKLEIETGTGSSIIYVHALDPSAEMSFQNELERLRARALSATPRDKSSAWRAYYAYLQYFAPLGPIYWSTVHKAQGSTFTRCYVALGDVKRNPNRLERDRCIYTAYTRAAKQLVIPSGS